MARIKNSSAGGAIPSVSTWFVSDDVGEETGFPSVPGKSSSKEFQDVYWRCVIVFFSTSLRFNKNVRHVFFTNTTLPIVDGLDIKVWFQQNNIDVVNLPLTYKMPIGAIDRFGNQFYLFDIINYLEEDNQTDFIILVDSDCVWMKSGDRIWDAISETGILTYPLWHSEDEIVNGINRKTLSKIYANFFGQKLPNCISYFGGDFFAASRNQITKISKECRSTWHANLKAFAENQPWCREEAHLLSIIYRKLGLTEGDASRFFKRIWTDYKFRNVQESDRDLCLWHLPAEKTYGFNEVFRDLIDAGGNLEFLPDRESYTEYMERKFWITKPSLGRKTGRMFTRIARKLFNLA